VQALKDLSLDVQAGEIIGILGPNGAGKTTLIEILEGLRAYDGGSAVVFGNEVRHGLKAVRSHMGVAMQTTALPPLLTVHELLRLYAAMYREASDTDQLIALVGLTEKRNTLIQSLSGGQAQRLSLAVALVGNPDLLFLDEPTSSLDPQGRRVIWDLLLDKTWCGARTVVLTTHQMEEAQQLCTRVAILDRGEILAVDTPARLIERHCPGHYIRFETSRTADLSVLHDSAILEPDQADASRIEVAIHTDELESGMEALLAARRRGGFALRHLRVESATLEDVFLQLTGRRIRD
jgi:ABC-2 type transport system ATP-binding protein